MPRKPKFVSNSTLFGDDVPRRRIVVSTYLTEPENDAMVAEAQAARVTQKEHLKQCLDNGVQNGNTSTNQTQGDLS